MIWTEQQTSTLKLMHADGHSAGSIALKLGVSRGTVAGKARRLGIVGWKSTKCAWDARPGALDPVSWERRRQIKALDPPPPPVPAAIPPKLRHIHPPAEKALSKTELRRLFERAWINTATGGKNARSG